MPYVTKIVDSGSGPRAVQVWVDPPKPAVKQDVMASGSAVKAPVLKTKVPSEDLVGSGYKPPPVKAAAKPVTKTPSADVVGTGYKPPPVAPAKKVTTVPATPKPTVTPSQDVLGSGYKPPTGAASVATSPVMKPYIASADVGGLQYEYERLVSLGVPPQAAAMQAAAAIESPKMDQSAPVVQVPKSPNAPPATPTPGVEAAWAEVQRRQTEVAAQIQQSIQFGADLRVQSNQASTTNRMDVLKRGRATEIEQLLIEEEARQRMSGSRSYDAKFVNAAYERYATYANQLTVDVNANLDEFDRLMKSKDTREQLKGQQLLASPAFRALMREHERVHGKAGASTEGAAAAFYQRYDRMALANTEFLTGVFNRQAVESRVRLYAGNNPAMAADIREQGSGKQSVQSYGFKTERYEDHNGALRTRIVPKTVFDYSLEKQQEVEAAYKSAKSERDAQIVALKRYGVDAGGLDPRERRTADQMASGMTKYGITEAMIKENPNKWIPKLVDSMMLEFDQQNQAKATQTQTPGGGFGIDATKMASYQAMREQRERELYGMFNAKEQGVMEYVFAVPGVEAGLNVINAGIGGIGSLVRGATMNAGELVGPGFDISKASLLEPWKGIATRPNTFLGFGVDDSTHAKARMKTENDLFWEEFNKGDFGDKLRVLGAYGSEPFSDDSALANLGFQVVADPLNVIPVNVFSYAARARLASESAALKTGSRLSKAPGAINDFRIGEGVLRRDAFVKAETARLGLKETSISAVLEQRIRDEVAGLPDDISTQAAKDRLSKLYLTKSGMNAHQLDSFVQQLLVERLGREGLSGRVVTQATKNEASAAARTVARVSEDELAVVAQRVARERVVGAEKAEAKRLASERTKMQGVRDRLEGKAPAAKVAVAVPSPVSVAPDAALDVRVGSRSKLDQYRKDGFVPDESGDVYYWPEGKVEWETMGEIARAKVDEPMEDLYGPKWFDDPKLRAKAEKQYAAFRDDAIEIGIRPGSVDGQVDEYVPSGGARVHRGGVASGDLFVRGAGGGWEPLVPAAAVSPWVARNTHLGESQWLKARGRSLSAAIRSGKLDPKDVAKAKRELRSISDSLKGMRIKSTPGGRGMLSVRSRKAFASQVVRKHGDEAAALLKPNRIAPFARTGEQIAIERARDLRAVARSLNVTSDGPAGAMLFSQYEVLDAKIAKALDTELGGNVRGMGQGRIGPRDRRPDVELDPVDMPEPKAPRPRDTDPRVTAIKDRILSEAGFTSEQYDLAGRVFRQPMVRANRAASINKRVVDDAGYVAERAVRSQKEAKKLLGRLSEKMHGQTDTEVWREFERQFTYSGEKFKPREATGFELRSLEASFEELSGGIKVTGDDRVVGYLNKGGIAPWMGDRAAFRAEMERIGEFTPREGQKFLEGEPVWSLGEEAKFFEARYGQVPKWADAEYLRSQNFFSDFRAHQRVQAEVGGFNRNLKGDLSAGRTAEEIRRISIRGEDGAKPKMDVFAEREFAKQRYGAEVWDGTKFIEMPWLMSPREYVSYATAKITAGIKLPPDLMRLMSKNWRGVEVDTMATLEKSIAKAFNRYWHKVNALPPGAPIDDTFMQEFSANIVNDLLASKEWLPIFASQRGPLPARVISVWSTVTRATVLWHTAFLAVNVPDVLIRSAYHRFAGRAHMADSGVEAIEAAVRVFPGDITGFYEKSTLRGVERARAAAGGKLLSVDRLAKADKVRLGQGLFEALTNLPGDIAGRVEIARKQSLAARIYESAYQAALKRGNNEGLSRAMAEKWMKKETNRIFPTMEGAGPTYKLFNELAPFFNYQLKNSTLWLREAAFHPAYLNKIHYLSEFIEDQNRKLWASEHPDDPDGSTMPDHLASRIPLPWATDTFIDLRMLTDVSRGLKLLANREQTIADHLSGFFRLVSPAPLAVARGILDSQRIGGEWKFMPTNGADGFPNGGFQLVWQGLGEPWSKDPVTLSSVVWPLDLVELFGKLNADGSLDNGDVYQLLSKALFYGEFSRANPTEYLADIYAEIKARDSAAAKKFLAAHPEILDYWKASVRPRDFVVPRELTDFYRNMDPERRWWYVTDPTWRENVQVARDGLGAIIKVYDERIAEYLGLPWDPVVQELKAQKRAAVSDWYLAHPELIQADVLSSDAKQWAKRQENWQLDDQIRNFYGIQNTEPKRADFLSVADYEKAKAEWAHEKATFLKAFPGVEQRLGGTRTAVQAAMDKQYKEWGETFEEIAARNVQIKAAELAGDRTRAQVLRDANSAAFQSLEHDQAVPYFTADEMAAMSVGRIEGVLETGGRAGIARVSVLPDYEAHRWAKATPEERAKITIDQKYRDKMAVVVNLSRGVGGFVDPGKLVAGVKADPWLKTQYLARHSGKAQQWADSDAYVAAITAWGAAKHEGKFDKADDLWNAMPKWMQDRYFGKTTTGGGQGDIMAAGNTRITSTVKGLDRQQKKLYGDLISPWGKAIGAKDYVRADREWAKLPKWVQDRYLSTHPKYAEFLAGDRKVAREGHVANVAYVGAMQRWILFMDRKDYAGGEAYFNSLPKWMQDRYYNDPEKGAARRQQRAYGNYMEEWVGLIAKGKTNEAQAYFDKLPQWAKDKYYGDPEDGTERRKTRDYIKHLDGWISLLDKGDQAGAHAYFDTLPKWVKDRYYLDPEKGNERRLTRDFGNAMEAWTKLIGAKKYDEASVYFDSLPGWMQKRYYNDPEKGAERRQTREFGNAMEGYLGLIDAGKFDEARVFLDGQPLWVRDRYYNDPEKGLDRRQSRDYAAALEPWLAKLEAKDFDGAKVYFDGMPAWMRERYFEKHPDKRGEENTYKYASTMKPQTFADKERAYYEQGQKWLYEKTLRASQKELGAAANPRPAVTPTVPGPVRPDRPTYPQMPPAESDSNYIDLKGLDEYFRLPIDQQGDFLARRPDIAQYLANVSTDDQRYRFAVMSGYRSIPKEESWLRRIYQERYSEIFDPTLVGEYRQRQTYEKLGEHPELLPSYEKYFKAIYESYGESLKYHGSVPKPIEPERMKAKRRRRSERGRSAAWTSR